MEVSIVERKSLQIVGLSIHTLLQDVDVNGPALHARYEKRVSEIANRIHPDIDYAVSVDPPNYNDETDEYKLLIGVEVASLEQIPHEMESYDFLGTFACLLKTDHSAFGALIRWVNQSEYELADIYSIEVHDHTNNSIVLMFPILKK